MYMSIASITDLEHAKKLNRWLNRPEVDEVIINIKLEEHEKKVLQARLRALFNDCGCFWGAPTFLIFFLGLFVSQITRTGVSWVVLGSSFLFALLAAVLAKLIALYISHLQLKRELDVLVKLIILDGTNSNEFTSSL